MALVQKGFDMALTIATIRIGTESSSEPLTSGSDDVPDLLGYRMRHTSSGSGYEIEITQIEPQSWMIKRENSTAQNVQWLEQDQEYVELGEILSDLASRDGDDNWWISDSVYSAASNVATWLKEERYPVPQVFVHGPTSVVFNWMRNERNLYLTVSSESVSALTSTPERIEDCREISWSNSFISIRTLLPIQSALLPGVYISDPGAGSDSSISLG